MVKKEVLYERYIKARVRRDIYLWSVYQRPSKEKERKAERLMKRMKKEGGYALAIPSHNLYTFTFAYLHDEVNPDTGEVTKIYLRYITPIYDYNIDVTEMSENVYL